MNELRTKIQNGEIYWITLLTQDFYDGDPDINSVRMWSDFFLNPKAMIAYDKSQTFINNFEMPAYTPAFMVIEGDMTIKYYDANADLFHRTIKTELLENY